MCGSTNAARVAAFLSALSYLQEQGAAQIGTEAPKGQTRQHIEFVQNLGGGEPPVQVVALADAEDKVLALVRDAQIEQQTILVALLKGYPVTQNDAAVERFVASLNNIKDASVALEAAQADYDAEAARVHAEIADTFGDDTADLGEAFDALGNKPTLQ